MESRCWSFLVLALVCFAACVVAQEDVREIIPGGPAVEEPPKPTLRKILGSDWYENFDKYEYVLVVFVHSKECKSCNASLEEVAKSAEALKDTLRQPTDAAKGQMLIGQVDCSKQFKLCNKYDKRASSTSKAQMSLFSRAVEVSQYDDTFMQDKVTHFIERTKDKIFVYPAEELEKYEGPAFYGVFFNFDPKNPPEEYALFMKTAAYFFNEVQILPEPRFGIHVTNSTTSVLASRLGVSTTSIVFKHGSEDAVLYTGNQEETDLRHWAVTSTAPLLIEGDSRGANTFWKQGKPVALFWLDYADPKANDFITLLSKVSMEHKSDMFFMIADKTKNERPLTFFGYSQKKFPVMMLYDTQTKFQFKFSEDEEMTESSIKRFIQSFFDRTLRKFVRKQEAPTENTGSTRVIVYDTWKEIVNDPTKDVAVFFYVPNCDFCMDFLKVFEEAAADMKAAGIDHITFAKMDMEKNESPQPITVRNFPSIYLFPSKVKHQHKIFNAMRTREKLFEFLQDNASNSFKVPEAGSTPEPAPAQIPEEDLASLREMRHQILT